MFHFFHTYALRQIAYPLRRLRQSELLWLLAIATEKGDSVPDVVQHLADESSGGYRKRLMTLAEELRRGSSLADVTQELHGLLPAESVLVARVGESCGNLPQALRQSAGTMSRRGAFDGLAAQGSLVYLAGLLTTLVLVAGFIMYYIIPKFKMIFEDFGTELPNLTLLSIQVSDGFVNYWYLAPLLGALLVAISLATVSALEAMGSWRIGFLRPLYAFWNRQWTPAILRALQVTVDAQVPLVQGYRIVAHSLPDRQTKSQLAGAIEYLEHGGSCWPEMQQMGFLRQREVAMLSAAERAHNLGWALETLAEEIERKSRFRREALLQAVRPLFLILFAILVGLFVISMFLPLTKLINDLS